jgi:hypothetical protein
MYMPQGYCKSRGLYHVNKTIMSLQNDFADHPKQPCGFPGSYAGKTAKFGQKPLNSG